MAIIMVLVSDILVTLVRFLSAGGRKVIWSVMDSFSTKIGLSRQVDGFKMENVKNQDKMIIIDNLRFKMLLISSNV